MKIQNLCTKRSYEKNGEKKTVWLNIGQLRTNDDGKQFVQINLLPDVPIYVFDQKEKTAAGPQAGTEEEAPF